MLTDLHKRILALVGLAGVLGALLVAMSEALEQCKPQWDALVAQWRLVFPARIDVNADEDKAKVSEHTPKQGESPQGETDGEGPTQAPEQGAEAEVRA